MSEATRRRRRRASGSPTEVTSWPGVEAGNGERGEWGFTLGRRQLGHLHGDHAFHGGFPKEIWFELYEQGRIDYHPVFPASRASARGRSRPTTTSAT